MKAVILLTILLNVLYETAFSQCPEPGLKIQSASCDSPRNLSVMAITCPALKVKWQGSQNQTYTIKATETDMLTGQVFETTASSYSCDNNGNCQAAIPVRENTKVNWSVQGNCTEGTNTLTGYQSVGAPVSIPLCQQIAGNSLLRVYPNPSNGDLTVEYSGDVSGKTTFTIFDMAGKKVFSQSGDAITSVNGGYKLDLHNLFSGTYLLKISNGKENRKAKFVLIRD